MIESDEEFTQLLSAAAATTRRQLPITLYRRHFLAGVVSTDVASLTHATVFRRLYRGAAKRNFLGKVLRFLGF